MRRVVGFRHEHGVAMTEFALILPVFIVIVAGLLGFGRVFFYWISANHLANETARWAAVDRNPNPSASLQEYARDNGGTVEFTDARVCIRYAEEPIPPSTEVPEPAVGGPVEVTIAKPFSFVPILDVLPITIRGQATMRIERFADGTAPQNYSFGSPFGPCS